MKRAIGMAGGAAAMALAIGLAAQGAAAAEFPIDLTPYRHGDWREGQTYACTSREAAEAAKAVHDAYMVEQRIDEDVVAFALSEIEDAGHCDRKVMTHRSRATMVKGSGNAEIDGRPASAEASVLEIEVKEGGRILYAITVAPVP